VDVLVRSGAVLHDIADYAGAGSIPDDVPQDSPCDALTSALRGRGRLRADRRQSKLLAHGVDVNADLDGATALHWAAWHAQADSIAHLLDRGADAARRDAHHDMTARQWYLYRRDQLAKINNPDCWNNAARIEQLLTDTG